jgi:hypothetical protein
LARLEFESGTVSMVLPLSCFVWRTRLLISWCAGGRCDTAGSDKDLGRSRRPGVEDWGWSSTGHILGGRRIRRLGDTVCDLHHARRDEESGFLG